MGYFGGSSTTTVQQKTEELSPVGRQWENLYTQITLANLDEFGGWDINPVQKYEYKDRRKSARWEGEIQKAQEEIDEIQKDLEANPARDNDPRLNEIKNLENKIQNAENQLSNLEVTSYTDYQLTKEEDPRVKDLIDKYGEESDQVKNMRAEIEGEKVFEAETMAKIEHDYLHNVQKYVSGDYTYSDEQEQMVEQFIGPIRDTIKSATQEIMDMAQMGGDKMREGLTELRNEINRTGYDVLDALEAAEVQIQQSGETLLGTLQWVNQAAENKAKFEFDLLAQQADQQAAQQGALLGLPPGSMTEKVAATNAKNQALKSVLLNLELDKMERTMGIVSDIEGEKRSIGLSKVMLAEAQGAKKERAAELGLGITEKVTDRMMEAASAEQAALLQLEQQKSGQLFNLASGNLPAMIQTGQSGIAFQPKMTSANIGISQQLMQPISGALGTEQQRTFAEATKTTTTRDSPSMFSNIGNFMSAMGSVARPFIGLG